MQLTFRTSLLCLFCPKEAVQRCHQILLAALDKYFRAKQSSVTTTELAPWSLGFSLAEIFTTFLPFSLEVVYLQLTEKQRGCSHHLPSHYLQAAGRRHCHLCFLPLMPIICYCLSYSKLLHCFISGIVYPACHQGACNPDFLECCTLILQLHCSMIAQLQLFLSTPG